MKQNQKFFNAEEVVGRYIEVVVETATGDTTFYWVDVNTIPANIDTDDYAITLAKSYYSQTCEADWQDWSKLLQIYAYPPFSRYQDEVDILSFETTNFY